MAGIGAFISSNEQVVEYLRYNTRSQIFAKALPLPITIGMRKRLELLRSSTELKDKLWTIVNALQSGLKAKGFNIGNTESPVTPVFLQGTETEAVRMIMDLRENYSIFCSMVVYPVVPKGVMMLRIIPTAAHSLEDVDYTLKTFEEIQKKLSSGYYEEAFTNLVVE